MTFETFEERKQNLDSVGHTSDGAPITQSLVFGKYSDWPMSTLEDFAEGEWHGEAEFEANDGNIVASGIVSISW